MDQDLEQIRLISIFHYIIAGIAGLFACFPVIHLLIGISILTGSIFPSDVPSDLLPFPFILFGLMFTLLPAAMIFLGWAFAIGMALAGYFLTRKRHYMFCLVMAGISCVFMPFGTVLGVFTIVVLIRPSVKELFAYPGPAMQS